MARILDLGQVSQGFADVFEHALGRGRDTVGHRQLELGFQPGERGSQAVQRRRQLRLG